FRKHLLKVVELNRETWKHIRAETDDDDEWLPNAHQHGVLGLPVRDDMIDAWLSMLTELEALLEGRGGLPRFFFDNNTGTCLNLKTFLDDPPEKLVLDGLFPRNLPEKYWFKAKEVDISFLFRVAELFGDPSTVAYADWFN